MKSIRYSPVEFNRPAAQFVLKAVMAGNLLALLLLGAPGTSRADNLFIADNADIYEFSAPGTGTVFATAGSYSFTGLAFSHSGKLFAAIAGDNTIEEFDSTGGVLSTNPTVFASTGLSGPHEMAFDSGGSLYVANSVNNTIGKFYPSGTGTVFANSGLSSPMGLAFDSKGNLFVANRGNDTIEEFNSSGTGAVFASGLSTFTGLAFDSAGNLYAANEAGNGTIEKFSLSGGVLSSNSTVFATSGLSNPHDLAFDSAGDLYVANNGNNTIVEFDSSGSQVSSSSVPGPVMLAMQPIPEPSTWALLAVAFGLLALFSVKRSRC